VLGAALARLTADLPVLLDVLHHTTSELAEARRRYADLLAAARAALAAEADGEPDAWAYLRDEITHQTGRQVGGWGRW
jgi:hypothetical protein